MSAPNGGLNVGLDDLDRDAREAFAVLLAGVRGLEDQLPATCTGENEALVGRIIQKARQAEKLAEEGFHAATSKPNEIIKRQRALWKPLAERAKALILKATGLVEALMAAQRARKEAEEAKARQLVAEAQRRQAEAEAKALAADDPAARAAALKDANAAWNETRTAVDGLSGVPASTKVAVGDAVVFEVSRLDYEVSDMGAFATAHPDLVEIRRGPTLAALRAAAKGLPNLPETLPGWPGLKLKMATKVSAR